MQFVADRKGAVWEEDSWQDKILEWIYGHFLGRLFIKPFIRPAVSELGGRALDTAFSKVLIAPFICRHSVNMAECEEKEYTSYNDFFKRRLVSGARRIEMDKGSFISPCDSRLTVCKIDRASTFSVKHTWYTAAGLLRDYKIADRYAGGYIWIFRLCVDDYHRYIYVDNGVESQRRRIPGVFHTVNPAAGDRLLVYKENTREYSLLRSENFGTVLQMEVGALLVGKIENRQEGKTVKRGQEKGNFAFGGSTVILMTQAGKVRPDEDILKNSTQGIETKVRLGERIGGFIV
ncbi:phosphatidylserine decarboxylase [Lachnospiraceae bacterium 42-17]